MTGWHTRPGSDVGPSALPIVLLLMGNATAGSGGRERSSKGFVLPGTEKPTVDNLSRWFRRQWMRWRERRWLDNEIREATYKMSSVDPSGPNGEESQVRHEIVRLGIIRTLMREYVGILSSESPRVEVLADGLGPDKQRRASQVEEWDEAWWVDSGSADVQQLVDADAVLYGRGLSYCVWAREYWSGFPDQEDGEDDRSYVRRVDRWSREAPNPILRIHTPAPQTMFDEDEWVRTYGQPRVLHWYHRPLSEIAMAYPDSDAADRWRREGRAGQDPVMVFITYANRRWMAYAVAEAQVTSDVEQDRTTEASLIDVEPRGWEMLATYEHGIGRNPFEVLVGDLQADPSLVHRFAGLFDGSRDLIAQVDEAVSQAATAVRRYGRAQLVLTHEWGPQGQLPGGVNPDTMEPREIAWDPGVVLSLAPGERLAFVQPDLNAYKAGLEYMEVLQRWVARDTIDPSAWSGGASGSGYQLVTLIQTAERKLKALVSRKVRSIEKTYDIVHAIVAHIDRPVRLWRAVEEESDGGSIVATGGWVTLAPKEALQARVRVRYAPRLDSAAAAQAQIGIQLAQATSNGWLDLDKDWILSRWMGLENPERHRRAGLIQRFLQSQEIQQWLTRQALQEADMLMQGEDVAQAKQAQGLSPADMLLAPAALQAELARRGLAAGDNVAQVMGGAPGAASPGAAPPGAMQGAPMPGQVGGGQVLPAGAPPGAGASAAGLNTLMSAIAANGAPMPGLGTTVPGGPGSTQPAALQLGGATPQGSPFGGLDALRSLSRFGRPRSPAEAGEL